MRTTVSVYRSRWRAAFTLIGIAHYAVFVHIRLQAEPVEVNGAVAVFNGQVGGVGGEVENQSLTGPALPATGIGHGHSAHLNTVGQYGEIATFIGSHTQGQDVLPSIDGVDVFAQGLSLIHI